MGNILNFDNLTKDNIYVLNSPILSNSQFLKFNNFFKKKIKLIDCTFKKEESLDVVLEKNKKRFGDCCSTRINTNNFIR